MKSHVILTMGMGAGLTQLVPVLAAPYIERPTRELTGGHETVTTTASAELYHIDGLPGLPKPVISTASTDHHTDHHHAHGTEAVTTVDATASVLTYGAVGSFTEVAKSASETALGLESIVTEVETETVDIKTVTVAASADHNAVTTTTTHIHPEVPMIPIHPRGLGLEVEQEQPQPAGGPGGAGPGPAKQQFTTLTFTFDTWVTTYTLALPGNGGNGNGVSASDVPAPVIRPSQSFPLAPPSGTWTKPNTMVTSTVPAAAAVIRRSAPTSPVSPVETHTQASVSGFGYNRVVPIPAPNPNLMEEAALSATTPAPTLPRPREQMRTTILKGGEGAVERVHSHSMDANHSDAPLALSKKAPSIHKVNEMNVNDDNEVDIIRDDRPGTSHDMSWYFTASYTDDSVPLTMQPCYFDWQCWPESTSSNTEVFLPGVDGGRVAAPTQAV